MSADESDLQFIRCPGCRSLVPAVATRCRMCGQLLEPKSKSSTEALNKKSRVRQRTMSVSEDERDQLKDQVLSGEFDVDDDDAGLLPVVDDDEQGALEEMESNTDDDDFPVDAEPYEDLPEEVRGFAERGERGGVSSSGNMSQTERHATLEESWSFDEIPEVVETLESEEDSDDQDDFDDDLDERNEPSELQPAAKKRRRRKRKKKGNPLADENVASEGVSSPVAPSAAPSVASSNAPSSSGMVPPPRGIGWNRPEASSSERTGATPSQSSSEQSNARTHVAPRPTDSRSSESRGAHSVGTNRVEQGGRENSPGMSQQTSGSDREQQRRDDSNTDRPAAMKQRSTSHVMSKPIGEVAEAGSGELVGWLVYADREGNSTSRELHGGQFFVSRERLRPQDVVFEHPSVSMPQCLIFAHEHGGVTVQDLMSEHGTFLRRFRESDFQRQHGQFRVEHGDSLRFGELEIMLCLIPTSR